MNCFENFIDNFRLPSFQEVMEVATEDMVAVMEVKRLFDRKIEYQSYLKFWFS